MSLFTSTLNVGAMVEPLTSQMAEYLGVQGGLMVKQVAHKSEAAKAGLKAFDVILKVGSDSIATSADWDRALRSNVGKPVQVTILRDRKQQTLSRSRSTQSIAAPSALQLLPRSNRQPRICIADHLRLRIESAFTRHRNIRRPLCLAPQGPSNQLPHWCQ
jgi:membrane-associated protease RseP (regulator of RpoE activity)